MNIQIVYKKVKHSFCTSLVVVTISLRHWTNNEKVVNMVGLWPSLLLKIINVNINQWHELHFSQEILPTHSHFTNRCLRFGSFSEDAKGAIQH